MQDRVIMSGIGGQGIVVGTRLLGIAVTAQGGYALHYAQYGGEMRGTLCECTLTLADAPVDGAPQVSACEVAVIMHPESFDRLTKILVPGGLALVNASLIDVTQHELRPDIEWVLLRATDLGRELGHNMVATMVTIGALAQECGFVPPGAIAEHLDQVIPTYRHQLLEMDAAGIQRGAAAVSAGEVERIAATDAAYRFADRAQAVGAG